MGNAPALARALILFEDRLPAAPFSPIEAPIDIVADADIFAALIGLADTIGVKIPASSVGIRHDNPGRRAHSLLLKGAT